jgi:hypothetical protein
LVRGIYSTRWWIRNQCGVFMCLCVYVNKGNDFFPVRLMCLCVYVFMCLCNLGSHPVLWISIQQSKTIHKKRLFQMRTFFIHIKFRIKTVYEAISTQNNSSISLNTILFA